MLSIEQASITFNIGWTFCSDDNKLALFTCHFSSHGHVIFGFAFFDGLVEALAERQVGLALGALDKLFDFERARSGKFATATAGRRCWC